MLVFFSSNLVVLVNGFPTQENNIQRGLNQGDPIYPFLFLLVSEGMSGLFYRAMDQQLFSGLGVGFSYLMVPHL